MHQYQQTAGDDKSPGMDVNEEIFTAGAKSE